MVTCIVCRHEVDEGGHAPQCPSLIEDLRVIRHAAELAHAKKELSGG